MKKSVLVLTAILFFSLVNALPDLEVQKIEKSPVVISELNNPATYELIINNKGESDKFQIYSLVGISFTPKDKFILERGKNSLEIYAWPNEDLRKRSGLLNLEYQLKGENSGIFKDTLLIKIVPLSEVLEITSAPLLPNEDKVKITVKNKENTILQNVNIEFESEFFSDSSYVSLFPYEEKEIPVKITKNTNKLLAGPYIMKSTVEIKDKKVEYETIIDYQEREGLSVEEITSGAIIKKTSSTKTNNGNTPVTATISIKKDAVSRLFTINSPSPISTERSGLSVTYTWQEEIAPTESLSVTSTTNYTIPLIIFVLIIIVGVFAKIYSQTALTLNKKVSFVRTKSGELALKVNIAVKARRYVDKIQIVDTLPGMTILYEKFGKLPDRIDNASRRLFWNLPSLNAGEERVFSYIIYSKLKVVGRFELPAATAIFEHEGKTKEAWSNRTFFVSGQSI